MQTHSSILPTFLVIVAGCFRHFNRSVEFLEHWRRPVIFDVLVKKVIWERRIFAACVLDVSQLVSMF